MRGGAGSIVALSCRLNRRVRTRTKMRTKTTAAARAEATTVGASTPNSPVRVDEPAAVWVLRSALHAWADNPRKNDGEPVAKVAASIKRFGFASPIIARSNGEVIAGHTRLKAAEVLGLDRVPVRYLDLDPAEAHLLALADNKLNEEAEWHSAAVASLLSDYSLDDAALAGWDSDDLEKLADELGALEPKEVVEDEVPEVPVVPVTKVGDLWLLGEHRVLCGDSTKAEDVARFYDGAAVGCVLADPPYGVRLDVDFSKIHPTRRKGGTVYQPVIGDDKDFDAATLVNYFSNVAEQFWWGADYYRKTILDGGSWIVWDKRANNAGMNLDAFAGSVFELAWSRQAHKREILRHLWSGHHGMQSDDTSKRVHPTQKPVALIADILVRWAPKSCVVADPFLGSGTTLIAAEQLGRKCYGMEISPQYCDVIVKRWENLTGKTATLEAS